MRQEYEVLGDQLKKPACEVKKFDEMHDREKEHLRILTHKLLDHTMANPRRRSGGVC